MVRPGGQAKAVPCVGKIRARLGWKVGIGSTLECQSRGILKDVRGRKIPMMEKSRNKNRRVKAFVALAVALALVATLGVALLATASSDEASEVELQPGPFAPSASGEVAFNVENGVLSGHVEANGLPAQGAHAFYVLWFVRTDTGDKVFLGPVVHDNSILFLTGGGAEMSFKASAFTSGRHTGSAISLGAAGSNFFVLIAENHIDTFMPFPVSPLPSSFALTATF
jgi:hypothetical protein